jgi:type III secretory pathway lipoprotein EscJ
MSEAEMEHGVRLTVVPSESEAEAICGLLRVNGIRCDYREAGVGGQTFGSWWHEILVPERQLAEARELLESDGPTPPQ